MFTRSVELVVVLGIAGVIVLFAVAPASANVVNVTTGQTLFYDDFEQLGNSVSHAAYQDTSGDYDPVGGAPGSWNVWESQNQYIVQVTDHVGGNDPGAYQGKNYARQFRNNGIDDALPWQTFADQSTVGQTVRWSQMIYVNGYDSESFDPGMYGSNGGIVNMKTGGIDHSVWYNVLNGGSHQIAPSELSYNWQTWQKWTWEYTIGNANHVYSLTIGDPVNGYKTKTDIPMYDNTASDVNEVVVSQGTSYNLVYWDEVSSVPEPSTSALLIAGLIGLLAYAWRKRR